MYTDLRQASERLRVEVEAPLSKAFDALSTLQFECERDSRARKQNLVLIDSVLGALDMLSLLQDDAS